MPPATSWSTLTSTLRCLFLSKRAAAPQTVICEERWRGGELHRDAEPPSGPGGEGQGSLVCLDDPLDDCQAEADACVVGAYAFAAPLKRLGKRGSQLWGELLAGVLDGEHHARGVSAGRDPYGALFRQVVDDRVVHEVRSHLKQERG